MIGLIGQKAGMTRIFTESGESVPVTVIKVNTNRVTQIKTSKTDGYKAVQVTTGERRSSRVNKPRAGHFAKANTEAGSGLWEFRLVDNENCELKLGDELNVTLFTEGQLVDVSATSKGKGFQGGVKRHNLRMQCATHGNSVSHRAIGSTGQNQSPGRVFKGKKMPGQMGNIKVTVQNQAIVSIDKARNLLLIKGSVPGPAAGYVCINPAVKVA